jgi:succinoglycan biosynthesis transport protein ExoP
MAQLLAPVAGGDLELAQPTILATHYLWVIFRQKWKIIAFIFLCVLGTYLYSSRLTPIYEATATIDVDRQLPSGVIGQEASQALSAEDSDEFLQTQIELIQSDAVLRPVAQRFNLLQREAELNHVPADKAPKLTNAPVRLGQLRIGRPIETYILRISYRSSDPVLAADVANAIAESYLEHTYEIQIRSSKALSAFMERQLDELKAKMERSSVALARFEQELNIINPEQRTSIVSARLLQLNTEYTAAQADRLRKEATRNAIQSGSLAAAQISSQSDELRTLYDRLNQAKQHFADVATIYGPSHAEYRKAANTLAEVQRQFDETRRNVAQRVDTEYEEAVAREQMLDKTVAQTKAEFDELNRRSFDYQRLKREADADKALYSDLERRIKEAGINAGFQNSSIRIADLARPPAGPILPRTKMNVTLVFIIALVCAVCAAVLADVLDSTVRDPEQAARALDTTVLGALPAVKDMKRLTGPVTPSMMGVAAQAGSDVAPPSGFGIVQYSSRASGRGGAEKSRRAKRKGGGYQGIGPYEEAIRTLRHSILLPDFERAVHSILVTSANPGDGKSTAIIHLAIAHAEQGKRTLIVDADLRRPSVHKRLNLEGLMGLSSVLLGEIGWRETVTKVSYWPNLEVLPAGMASRRASDLVGSMMIDILDEASKEYDLIFVDAPPLLGFAEAMQIATAVDGVVVMARAGQTTRKAVGTVLATLGRLRANVIGLVLNEVDKNTTNGYYYYNDYRKYYAERSA